MNTLDDYSKMNYYKNIVGVMEDYQASAVPNYIKICKIKNAANTLTLEQTHYIKGVDYDSRKAVAAEYNVTPFDVTDDMILANRRTAVRDAIWYKNGVTDRLHRAIQLLEDDKVIESINYILR